MNYSQEQQERINKIVSVLENCGLQSTLHAFTIALEQLIKKRGHSIEGVMVLETLRGIFNGYCLRYEEEWEEKQGPKIK